MAAEERKRLSELPVAKDLTGLETLGVDKNNEGVRIPIGNILSNLETATEAVEQATQAAQQAKEAAQEAKKSLDEAKQASADITEATKAATEAKQAAVDAVSAANTANSQASEAKGQAGTAQTIATSALATATELKVLIQQQGKQIGLNTPKMMASEEAMEALIASNGTVEGQVYYTVEE